MRSAFFALLPVASLFVVHYAAANAYAAICTPLSVNGFLLSLVTTASPVCTGLLYTINISSNNYAALLGAFFMAAAAVALNPCKRIGQDTDQEISPTKE
jgi:hypothetical protein